MCHSTQAQTVPETNNDIRDPSLSSPFKEAYLTTKAFAFILVTSHYLLDCHWGTILIFTCRASNQHAVCVVTRVIIDDAITPFFSSCLGRTHRIECMLVVFLPIGLYIGLPIGVHQVVCQGIKEVVPGSSPNLPTCNEYKHLQPPCQLILRQFSPSIF